MTYHFIFFIALSVKSITPTNYSVPYLLYLSFFLSVSRFLSFSIFSFYLGFVVFWVSDGKEVYFKISARAASMRARIPSHIYRYKNTRLPFYCFDILHFIPSFITSYSVSFLLCVSSSSYFNCFESKLYTFVACFHRLFAGRFVNDSALA